MIKKISTLWNKKKRILFFNKYSTLSNNKETNISNLKKKSLQLKPLVIYSNIDLNKTQIFKENKNRAGVYRLVNKTNNKTYVGSSINITLRFYKYFNIKHLYKSKTSIHLALLKYGYSNFSLEIIEYCDINILLLREQYYIDLLIPEYNILQIAGSSLGYKHNQNTLNLFKNKRNVSEESKKLLSKAAIGRILSDAVKNKISASHLGKKLSIKTRARISATITSLKCVPIFVKNIHTNIEKQYVNLTEAGKALGVSRTAVKKALDNRTILKKIYSVTLRPRDKK